MPKPPKSLQDQNEERARFENTIAAILTLAVVGTAGGQPVEDVVRKYSDVVQRLRSIDVLNPPISGMPPNLGR